VWYNRAIFLLQSISHDVKRKDMSDIEHLEKERAIYRRRLDIVNEKIAKGHDHSSLIMEHEDIAANIRRITESIYRKQHGLNESDRLFTLDEAKIELAIKQVDKIDNLSEFNEIEDFIEHSLYLIAGIVVVVGIKSIIDIYGSLGFRIISTILFLTLFAVLLIFYFSTTLKFRR
jgi:hypothetical protein